MTFHRVKHAVRLGHVQTFREQDGRLPGGSTFESGRLRGRPEAETNVTRSGQKHGGGFRSVRRLEAHRGNERNKTALEVMAPFDPYCGGCEDGGPQNKR